MGTRTFSQTTSSSILRGSSVCRELPSVSWEGASFGFGFGFDYPPEAGSDRVLGFPTGGELGLETERLHRGLEVLLEAQDQDWGGCEEGCSRSSTPR